MVRTRRQRRPGSATRRSYRRRVRSSHCRSKGPAACRGTKGCKYASGRKRTFCRKGKNTRRHRRSRRSRRGGSYNLMNHVRKALVPYSIYHMQKSKQRKRKHRRRHRRRR